jgi:hypothetical protein
LSFFVIAEAPKPSLRMAGSRIESRTAEAADVELLSVVQNYRKEDERRQQRLEERVELRLEMSMRICENLPLRRFRGDVRVDEGELSKQDRRECLGDDVKDVG